MPSISLKFADGDGGELALKGYTVTVKSETQGRRLAVNVATDLAWVQNVSLETLDVSVKPPGGGKAWIGKLYPKFRGIGRGTMVYRVYGVGAE